MKNLSSNNEPIELGCNINYIIIDALYLEDIKGKLPLLDCDYLFDEIRLKVFPYTETPFIEYLSNVNTFTLDKIKKVKYDVVEQKDTMVSTDSGVLLFINENIFLNFIQRFRYDRLIGETIELFDFNYWQIISSHYNLYDLGIVISPGINSGLDFEGSGVYTII